jgi:metal-responsive CopG/Arc/MetJ family transcriptional regulator
MKRTTIMVEEDILYELKQIAQNQGRSTSLVIREALATYITGQHQIAPPENPLLSIIALGASEEPMDLSNGGDEVLLREGIHPVYGWSVVHDSDS